MNQCIPIIDAEGLVVGYKRNEEGKSLAAAPLAYKSLFY